MASYALSLLLLFTAAGLVAQGKPVPTPVPAPRLPSAARAAEQRTIAPGDTVRDSLTQRDVLLKTENTYAQQWRLVGRAGKTVTIDLASDAFDAYLFLLGPGLEHAAAPPQDDDSGGRCNARLTVRFPEDGDYFIVVTTSERAATGPFVLSVVAGSRPTALTPCTR
ncbi:MAG TPA: PPC domain-containing protein [Gemmatimonadales bacterium]|nr:PPC domain-containing protein [Gemmatimonadales bacterium]